jgi:outer membrane murein-binding lipoprotein Lpp
VDQNTKARAAHRAKLLFAAVVGGIIVAAGGSLYWLNKDNTRLENEKAHLEAQVQTLNQRAEELSAEGERLKAEALQNNVFLGNPKR